MDTYDSTQARRFRAALLDREIQLENILSREMDGARTDGAPEIDDMKEIAARSAAAELDDAQAAAAVEELSQVQAALRRIGDGTYGFCVDCDAPIDLRRLAAVPFTLHCQACQAAHEQHRP